MTTRTWVKAGIVVAVLAAVLAGAFVVEQRLSSDWTGKMYLEFSGDSKVVTAYDGHGTSVGWLRWTYTGRPTWALCWREVERPDVEKKACPVTLSGNMWLLPPKVSPDSRHAAVVLQAYRPLSPTNSAKLFVVDLKSGEVTTLVEGVNMEDATWFGDDEIAYVTHEGKGTQFWRKKIGAGSVELKIHEEAECLTGDRLQTGVFSPSGRYVLLTCRGGEQERVLVDMATGERRQTGTERPDFSSLENAWRPDETAVLCLSHGESNGTLGVKRVTLVEVPSGKTTDLWDLWSKLPSSAGRPEWTSDGKYVLVNTYNRLPDQAWLFSPKEGKMVAIGDRFSELVSPGKPFSAILKVLDVGGRLVGAAPDHWLWSIDDEGKRVERLCEMKDLISGQPVAAMGQRYVISPDGKWRAWIRRSDRSVQLEKNK